MQEMAQRTTCATVGHQMTMCTSMADYQNKLLQNLQLYMPMTVQSNPQLHMPMNAG